MKKPSFQFYPADWRNNAKLRRCTWEARGAWLEVMCLFHDSEEYGLLRWSLKELAQAIGAPVKLIKELADKGVLKGGDKIHEALIYTPRSGRVDGDPVTLIVGDIGACWYSSRMVIDEHIRQKKGESTRFTPSPNPSPKGGIGEGIGASPNPSPNGWQSDGSTSSSTTTYKNNKNNTHTIQPQGRVSDFSENPKTEESLPTTPAGEICKALKRAGLPNVSPQHPELLALIAKGVTVDQFADAAKSAVEKSKGFAYMLGIVRGQLTEVNAIESAPGMPDAAWNRNPQSVAEMAQKLNVKPWIEASSENAFRGEPYAVFLMRVTAAYEVKRAVPA